MAPYTGSGDVREPWLISVKCWIYWDAAPDDGILAAASLGSKAGGRSDKKI